MSHIASLLHEGLPRRRTATAGRTTMTVLAACLAITGAALAASGSAASAARAPSSAARVAGMLNAVDAASSTDAWAVGSTGDPESISEHWDGTTWSSVSTPSAPGARWASLDGVADLAPGDAWAVGDSDEGGGAGSTLAMRWNGSAWRIVSSPNVGDAEFTGLRAVSGTGPDDVWAVGYADAYAGIVAVAEHWDGQTWAMVTPPTPPHRDAYLLGVAALAPDDVWAVGNVQNGSAHVRTLVEHWDGTSWTIVPSANPAGADIVTLTSVSALADDDIWAAGRTDNDALIEHWDGKSWQVVSTGPGTSALDAVTAIGPHDVWTVGFAGERQLIEHWNGTTWTSVPGARGVSGHDAGLRAVAPGPGPHAWAVGLDETTGATLIERWNGRRWTQRH